MRHEDLIVRLKRIRSIPPPIKLGVIFSVLVLALILLVPIPSEVPIFLPLSMAGAGCASLTIYAILDLILRQTLRRLESQPGAIQTNPDRRSSLRWPVVIEDQKKEQSNE